MWDGPGTTDPAFPTPPRTATYPDMHTGTQHPSREHKRSTYPCPNYLGDQRLGDPCSSLGHIPFLECLFGFSSVL